MLTQRTNVLLTQEDYGVLTRLSRKHNKTMGELIRHAVRKTYKIKSKADSFEASLARIKKLTKGIKVTREEMREWVVAGRKYEE